MRYAPLLALLLGGCGLWSSNAARDPLGSRTLIGHSIADIYGCAGVPDATQQLTGDVAMSQWGFKNTSPMTKITITVVGSIEFGSASQCKMTITYLREGTVVDVAFPGCTGTLTGGPYADAADLVGECLHHPNSDSLPANYDAFGYLLNGKKPTSATP